MGVIHVWRRLLLCLRGNLGRHPSSTS